MTRIAQQQRYRAPSSTGRTSPSRWKTVRFLAVLAASAFGTITMLGANSLLMAAEIDNSWHSTDDIAAAAEALVLEQAGATDASLIPEAGYLDSRLKLARCTEELQTSMQSGSALTGRAMVQVECDGEQPWKIFVPVRVQVTDTVLVAGRSLANGHILTSDDILKEERDITRLRSGYLARTEDVVGKRLKRQLLSGQVITPSMLVEQAMIKRGQTVTITAGFGGLSIETAGRALMDGAVNERIEVENSGSKEVIEAIVRSPERVEVLVN